MAAGDIPCAGDTERKLPARLDQNYAAVLHEASSGAARPAIDNRFASVERPVTRVTAFGVIDGAYFFLRGVM